jgi:hypothetical protein
VAVASELQEARRDQFARMRRRLLKGFSGLASSLASATVDVASARLVKDLDLPE